jgi:hypothetical protein
VDAGGAAHASRHDPSTGDADKLEPPAAAEEPRRLSRGVPDARDQLLVTVVPLSASLRLGPGLTGASAALPPLPAPGALQLVVDQLTVDTADGCPA